tara:strand:+ start:278 stop:625 length:348 start_codon:yes stop_codon:yes gene_type:complete
VLLRLWQELREWQDPSFITLHIFLNALLRDVAVIEDVVTMSINSVMALYATSKRNYWETIVGIESDYLQLKESCTIFQFLEEAEVMVDLQIADVLLVRTCLIHSLSVISTFIGDS